MSIKPLIYRSTDAGAPQLTGQAGSLVAVLDAVLVNGYGVGVDAKAPAGWTLEFSGTNKRVYRNSVAHGTGTYLRIDDTGSEQLAEPRLAWMRAYESMTGVDVGSNPAPLESHLARGYSFIKSTVATAVTRPWVVFACSTYAYMFINAQGDTSGWSDAGLRPLFFGDYESFKPGDEFAFAVSGDNKQTYGTGLDYGIFSGQVASGAPTTVNTAAFILRDHSGVAGAVRALCALQRLTASGSPWGGSGGVYPHQGSGGGIYDDGLVSFGSNVIAGRMPGLLVPLHEVPLPDMQPIDVSGIRYVAKRFSYVYSGTGGTATRGQVLIEAYEHE